MTNNIAFKNIVLTTDLSDNAEAAAPYAMELAAKFGATLHLVHVFENILYTGVLADGSMGYDPTDWLQHAEEDRKRRLQMLAWKLAARDMVRVVGHYIHGEPTAEILKYAKENKVDCIVMATHGRTGFSHLLFGSVAEKIVRSSPCPVLTIKPHPVAVVQEVAAVQAQADPADVVMEG